nr:NAD(P)-binding domain-containing protein [Salaquimonas pukyongi]
MKVGFIGLGNVGAKLAGSLLRNNIDLTVHDLNEKLVKEFAGRGAKAAKDPAQMMRECDAVITCLPSPAASDAVMQQMLGEVGSGKIWMEMSTTDETEVKRLGAMVMERGVQPLIALCRVDATGRRPATFRSLPDVTVRLLSALPQC